LINPATRKRGGVFLLRRMIFLAVHYECERLLLGGGGDTMAKTTMHTVFRRNA
jgi:hypothetical protein